MEQTLSRAQTYQYLSCAFLNPQDPHLASEFPQLFSHNLTPDCSPYETEYGSSHIFWQSQQLADIVGFYRAFGVELKDTAHERVDHIAVELEFMSYLTLKEAHILKHRSDANVEITQDAERKFLKDHLAKWVRPFRDRIQKKLSGSAYAKLANLLVRFIEWDCRRLDIHPETLSFDPDCQVEPSVEDGCPLGGPGCA